MRIYVGIATLAVAAACSSPPEAESTIAPEIKAEPAAAALPAWAPELRISDDMAPEYQDAAVFAVERWRERGFEVAVSVVEPEDANFTAGDCATKGALGCAWPGDRVTLDVGELEACRWATLDGKTTCILHDAHATAVHELGHWLGILGHLPPGNVMAAAQPLLEPPTQLTDADVAAALGAHAAQ